jgi:hypothetical protein
MSPALPILSQVPLPAGGAIENWLISAAAIASMYLIGRSLFNRRGAPPQPFVTRTEFEPFRKQAERELGSLRDRLDARFYMLTEKIEQLRSDLLKDAEHRANSLHTRLNELESGLARVDERTRD